MPASYTHYQYGIKVLEQINNNEIKEIIIKYRNYYNWGLFGPDILFFYQPLKKNYVNQLGSTLHHNLARGFFEKALAINPNHKQLAYLFGFINHFILDSVCHPFINEFVEKNDISHYGFERDLDQAIMAQSNFDVKKCLVVKDLTLNKDLAKDIAPFFNLNDKTIFSAQKSFYHLNKLLIGFNPIKRKLLISALFLAKASSFQDMVITKNNNPKYPFDIKHVQQLFNDSIKISVKEISRYYDCYNNHTVLSTRFDYNYE